MIVSTSLKACVEDIDNARSFAQSLSVPFVERNRSSLSQLKQTNKATIIVIMERNQPVAYHDEERFFFHRGMSELRLLNMLRGETDLMIAAMGLESGMTVLDCTVGLATDALVAAHVAAKSGAVVGLDSIPLIAAITRWGLGNLAVDPTVKLAELNQAAKKINIISVDHSAYLAGLPDNSFDIVYFDPMFRHPKMASVGIQSLRDFADARSLDKDALRQALRVARSRVVVKEAAGSREFHRLGINFLTGGQYSSVQYGVLLKEEGV